MKGFLTFIGAIALVTPAFAQHEPVRVQVIDRGQADGILIQTPNKQWVVIDAGTDSAQATAMRDRWGVDEVALVITSHRHYDHYGGIRHVLNGFDVGLYVGNLDDCPNRSTDDTIRRVLSDRGIPAQSLGADTITIDGIDFIILPPDPVDDRCPQDENDNSVVVRMEYGEFAMLFTGDAETEQRQWLMANHPDLLDVEVLKASHHGSRNGTSPPWLAAVTPDHVVISASADNPYGHPHTEAVATYEAATNGRVYCTNRHGSVTILGFPDGLAIVRRQVESDRSCAFQPTVVSFSELLSGPDSQPIQIMRDGRLEMLAPDVDTFVIRPGDVLRDPADPRVLIVPDARGELMRVLPDVDTAGVQLRYNAIDDLFTATVRIGLKDLGQNRSKRNLADTLNLQVTASPGETNPSDLQILHTGLPYTSVRVVSQTMADSVRLIVQTPHFPATSYRIGIERESLQLKPATPSIVGFGLESIDVTVSLPPVFAGKPRSAAIESQIGRLSSAVVLIDSMGTGVVSIRSRSTGVDTISATVLGLTVGATTITYVPPILFFLATLAGSIIGGMIPDRQTASRSWRHSAWKVLSGIASGIILVALYSVGIVNLPAGVSETSVFAVAGLGGVFGLRAFDSVRKLLGASAGV